MATYSAAGAVSGLSRLLEMDDRVESLSDAFFAKFEDAMSVFYYGGYDVVSYSNSRIVVDAYYPIYGRLTVTGSNLLADSTVAVSSIKFSGSNGLVLSVTGSMQATVSGDVYGYLDKIYLADSDLSITLKGHFDGAGNGTIKSMSVTVTEEGGGIYLFSLSGSLTTSGNGMDGTITSMGLPARA